MRIKTRLRLNTWLSLSMIIFLVFSIIWLLRETDRASGDVAIASELRKAVFDRIMLRDDWLLNREDRARSQWYEKTQAFKALMESASQRFTEREARDILQDVWNDFEATASLFSPILEKYKRNGLVERRRLAFTEAESIHIKRLLLKAYSLNDNVNRLYKYSLRTAITARNKSTIVVAVIAVCSIAVLVINSILVDTITTRRLIALNRGVKIIGYGDLEHKINTTGNDELADLARASNEMAARLKESYTSLDNLRAEVSRRAKAEENLRRLSSRQQALLSAIPDIIMEVDVNNIYTWANRSGLEFFGEDVIGREAAFYFADQQDVYCRVEPLFRGSDGIVYIESRQRRKDGQERLLAWWCRALKDSRGNVIGILSSARDITENKLVEAEIKRLNEGLEQRVSERTTELSVKTAELERINRVFVDRELRIRELKTRIAELEKA
jgi:PAS domain S-box-containing protein